MALTFPIKLDHSNLDHLTDWLSQNVGPHLEQVHEATKNLSLIVTGTGWTISTDWTKTFYVTGPIQPYTWEPTYYVTFDTDITSELITEFLLKWN